MGADLGAIPVRGDFAGHGDPGAAGAAPSPRHDPDQHRRAELPRCRDTRARPTQQRAEVEQALGRIRACGIDVLNIDLVYGIAGQTEATWKASLDAALAWRPEELDLYPLYVRELTGLGRRGRILHDDRRLALYRAGRAHLLAAGYEQVSMRMFRRAGTPNAAGPAYCCQEDGMQVWRRGLSGSAGMSKVQAPRILRDCAHHLLPPDRLTSSRHPRRRSTGFTQLRLGARGRWGRAGPPGGAAGTAARGRVRVPTCGRRRCRRACRGAGAAPG